MKRLLPFPLASFGLLVLWVLLNQSLSLGHLLLGAGVAVGGGLVLTVLEAPKTRIRRPTAIFCLAWFVLTDILRSNIAVLRIILKLERRQPTSGFVNIPLDLRDPYGLAVLACIITSTPGTLWVDLDGAKSELMIHVLDLIDESDWIRTIKGRYEKLLRDIFE